jgi:hypothetical protein
LLTSGKDATDRRWWTRVALAMPLALSLYWSTVYRRHTRHDLDRPVFGTETAPAAPADVYCMYCRPALNLTPLYRHLHPETDHLRHRCHGVRPTTSPRSVTAVDTCVGQNLCDRCLSTSRGAFRAFRSGQLIVALQRLRHLRDHPPRDNYSRPRFVDRPTANAMFERSLCTTETLRQPSWSRCHRPILRTC